MKKEKAKRRRRKREGKGRSNIKDKARRSKIVLCGRSKKRCLGFPRNADKLDDSADRKL